MKRLKKERSQRGQMREINLEGLPYVGCMDIEDRRKLPQDSGIYFLIDEDETVQYIGKANNLQARWLSGHHKMRVVEILKNPRLAYLVVPRDQVDDLEKELIRAYVPPFNRVFYGVTPGKSFKACIPERSYRLARLLCLYKEGHPDGTEGRLNDCLVEALDLWLNLPENRKIIEKHRIEDCLDDLE